MSTANRHIASPSAVGTASAAFTAAWHISGGSRLEWTFTIADSPQGLRPLRAEARLIKGDSTRTLLAPAADDVELVEDPERAMVHIAVRAPDGPAFLATFERRNGEVIALYAHTPLLARLGLQGGRYESTG